jgi:hydrogenase maturation protease
MNVSLLVIGYGNPLRGDDGFGWRAAERLEADRLPGASVLTCHQLTPELADVLSQAGRAVFIDAADPGSGQAAPGTLSRRRIEAREPEASAFSHHLDPAGLLALARAWFGRCPEAELITVTGERFDFSETLSSGVESALVEVLRLVREM